MNSTPARFKTASIAASVASSPAYLPVSIFVDRVSVELVVASAKSRTVQFKAARAILTLCTCHRPFCCAIVITCRCHKSNSTIVERLPCRTVRKIFANEPNGCRYFIGGSDARVIMGDDEAALVRLWQEKRGEVEPKDLSGNLAVQLGLVTEDLNRRWYEANTGQVITDIQKHVRHPTVRWLAATPDGRVQSSGAVFESKFMLPWSFSEEAATAKYTPQLQHNMWVVAARSAVLSVITGSGLLGGD